MTTDLVHGVIYIAGRTAVTLASTILAYSEFSYEARVSSVTPACRYPLCGAIAGKRGYGETETPSLRQCKLGSSSAT